MCEVCDTRPFHRKPDGATPQLVAIFRPSLASGYHTRERALTLFGLGGPPDQLGGLVNIGYNCYINAVIQALAYTPGFPQFCLSLPNVLYQQHTNSAFFLDSFARVFSEMGNKRSASPTWILRDAGQIAATFSRPIQQDAHEFLMHLLERFDRECAAGIEGKTIVGHFFTCEVTIKIKCHHCGAVSSRNTKAQDIEVPMREFPMLAAAIETITSAVEIPIPGKCEHCKGTGTLTKASHFTKFPLVLIVTMMRFDNALKKIEDFLEFPTELRVHNQLEYRLYALILHDGRQISHGHFVACVRDNNGIWYRADDVCVYRIKEEVVFGLCPYVLFYKRVHG
jgi:ubiquitin carboxyl-terminal hydrolase 36/42